MHIFAQKSTAQKRAAKAKKQQVANLQDAQELIAELTELNATLTAQLEDVQQQLNDVQEIAATLLEK